MTNTTKTYPRAKVRPVVNGWAIDLLLRAGAKPIKVNATYATIEFAHKSALAKLGVKPSQAPAKAASPLQQEWKQGPGRSPAPAKIGPVPRGAARTNPGICVPCGRPMRPVGTKAAEYPGAVLRQRDGICQSCTKSQAKAAR